MTITRTKYKILALMLVVYILIICIKQLSAQPYIIEPLDSVISRIHENSKFNQNTRIANYSETKTKTWYHLLPSIGYNAIANGVSVSFNLSSIISIADKKRTQQYQINEWQRTENLETTRKIIEAKTAYRQLQNTLDHALQHQQVFEIDSISFSIKQKANQAHKINTEDYLEAKRKYIVHQSTTYPMRQRIYELANQISLLQQKELYLVAPFILSSKLSIPNCN
ncbi:MAG: hypothetical protein E6Q66_03710 [Pedobacter sp.]|nr:MAG: hypothetical protein E6Q66_03710 [Pedobacter sp.]